MAKESRPDKGFINELVSKPKVSKEATSVLDHYQERRNNSSGSSKADSKVTSSTATVRRLKQHTPVAKPKATTRLDLQYDSYLKKRRGD